jgi:pyruvate formate-lyase activating enzyme-like uncharacterized protein
LGGTTLRALINYQNSLVEANRKEYGTNYENLNFINYYEGLEIEQQRASLLESLEGQIQWDFKSTKTDTTRLSLGCRLCGEGEWSCLFINGKCNCNCFYCPTPQTDIGQPVTQTLTFEDPMTYVEYIRKFNFKGVSFSGGEPFLTFDRVKLFLKTLRRELPSDLYIWMYTNGTRVTKEYLEELARLGLNEIRYDIGATDYNLKPVMQAIGIIPTVTVEIPAVPDELPRLKECIRELAQAGLSYLNLHQLRLTPHNLPHLTAKGYQLTHGQRVTVPASEMAALEIIRFTKDEGINLPVNYCSFVYKNRFQKSGLRKKLAPHIKKNYQEITENGYIRQITLPLNDKTQEILNQLSEKEKQHLELIDNKQIALPLSMLDYFKSINPSFTLSYFDLRVTEGESPSMQSRIIKLNNTSTLSIEWAPLMPPMQFPFKMKGLLEQLATGEKPEEIFEDDMLLAISQYEQIESGLAELF